jgi:hypothetical protein
MKKLILLVLVVLCLSAIANAQVYNDKLKFSDIKVYVDDKKDDVSLDGDTVSGVKPGSKIKVDIEAENTFSSGSSTSDSDIRMEDISVDISVDSFDGGDSDYEDDSDMNDISPGSHKKVNFEFTAPYYIDDNTRYKMYIAIDGRIKNGTRYKDNVTLYLETDKTKHELIIEKTTLTPAQATCKQSETLSITLLNIGSEDEQDIVASISSSELDINQALTSFDIDSGSDEEDIKVAKTFNFKLPDKLATGSYPININVAYNDNAKTVTSTADLSVKGCLETTTTTPTTTTPSTPVVVTQPTVPATTTPSTTTTTQTTSNAQPTTTQPASSTAVTIDTSNAQPPMTVTKQEETFWAKNGTVLIILLYVVVIAAGIGLFMVLLKKK